jgi:hypothetical protein
MMTAMDTETAGKPLIDANGRPLVVYRGTARAAKDDGEVKYFTADRQTAVIYAHDRCAGTTDGISLVAAHLAIRNPARDADIVRIAAERGIPLDPRFPASGLESNRRLTDALRAAGFDGVVGTDGDMQGPPQPYTVYVTFDRRQIRVVEEHRTKPRT